MFTCVHLCMKYTCVCINLYMEYANTYICVHVFVGTYPSCVCK